MSTEYAARMEVLQRRREDLTAQRQAIEKRIALREATAAEFSAVALQSCKQKWKAQRSAALAAMKRNQEFVRSLHEMQKQLHDNWVRLKSDQSSNNARLEQEKARYNRRIEQIYPAWQEQLQRQRVRKLRELEERKRAVDRRRYLAKKSFEKEQTLDDLIRKTRHEIEMAENLEQNELYERDLLRTQNTMQAKEVDQSIREVALEARSYLQQQASKNLETISNGDGSETFEAMTGQLRSGLTVTGSLEPILETSEQFSPDEVGGALQMRDPDIIGKGEHTRDEFSSTSTASTVANPQPKKSEEKRGASFPVAPAVRTFPLENVPIIENRNITFSLGDIVASGQVQEEDSIQVPSTNNVTECNDASLPSIQPVAITRVEVLPHHPHDGVHETAVLTRPLSYDDHEIVEDVVRDIPLQTVARSQSSYESDLPSIYNGPSALVESESRETKLPQPLSYERDAETVSNFHPSTNAGESVLEQHSRHEDEWMTESIDDGDHTQNTNNPDISTTEVFDPEAPKDSVGEQVLQTKEPEAVPMPLHAGVLEPFSPVATGRVAHIKFMDEDVLLTSMQSDDFELSTNEFYQNTEMKPSVDSNEVAGGDIAPVRNDGPVLTATESRFTDPPGQEADTTISQSVTEKLTPPDRVKALGALIGRVEEGATEGDTFGRTGDARSSYESKRELLKMAVGGLKAQVAFYGSDICFELILEISRDLGPVLFPPKAFEGIMNDQKIRKLHQHNRAKELDLWKALSAHIKQLAQLNALPSANLVDLFGTAFLSHDPENQRSQRKLREFLAMLCGGKSSSPPKAKTRASPPPSPPKQEQQASSSDTVKPYEQESRIGTPSLLQTAFLQRQSPPKPKKAFGIASSGRSFNDRPSGASDVFSSMGSGPMRLSQKLMRGGKMNDYSEFEEEEEVDLQNLIGTKPAFGSSSASAALGRSHYTANASSSKPSAKQEMAGEDDEFDADF